MNREFWETRLKLHGHTGWSDPVIYAFDQNLRLAAVTHAIKSHVIRFGRAVDFGCGVGDFSQVLGRLFSSVVAADISDEILKVARDRLPAHVTLAMREEVWAMVEKGSADLILSITVLQHLVQDGELDATLGSFHGALSPEGVLVVLESFDVVTTQGHVRTWTEEEMLAHFRDAGFRVIQHQFFRNPVTTPPPSYLRYRASVITRALARLGRAAAARSLLHWHARRQVRQDEAFAPSPTGTSLLVLRRA